MRVSYYPVLIASIALVCFACEKSIDAFSSSGSSPVKNGSLSRVVTVGDHIYTVDDNHLRSINAKDPAKLLLTDDRELAAGVQTIFHNNGKLFIGSAFRMYLFDIASNPSKPALLSSFDYLIMIEPKDPILAFDSVIYATATSGIDMGIFRIFNNKDPRNPQLRASIPMREPRGMDRKDSTLYICDGRYGLRIYSITNAFSPSLVKTIDQDKQLRGDVMGQNDYYDVLIVPPLMFCYVKGALLNYDITSARNPVFLHKLQ